MPKEASKTAQKYLKYLLGKGIDIGCGDDPVTPDCMQWDIKQGDAQRMDGMDEGIFDWVFSSHCLEHMRNPHEAIHNWWSLVKDEGYMVVLVPDEDLYEQTVWPSVFNDDHKYTFTGDKFKSHSGQSINLTDLIKNLPDHKLILIETLDEGYDYNKGGVYDQSHTGADVSLAMVLQKIPYKHKRLTQLEQIIMCPECRADIIVTGWLTDKYEGRKYQVRCSRCNFVGKMIL